MKKCAKCGKENIDKAIYCANCGAKLDSNSTGSSGSGNKCPKCGRDNLDIATYCDFCGARLGTSPSSGSLNSQSSSKSSTKQSTINQNKEQAPAKSKTDEGPSNFKVFCCYVPLVIFIIALILSAFMNAYPESFKTTYEDDFAYLDMDGDGRLSFDEARQYDPYMKDKEIRPYFSDADRNGNGYLVGYEFDDFRRDVRYSDSSIYSTSSSSSSSDDDKYKYSSSSSSSSSSNKHKHSSSSSGTNKYVNELNDMEFDNNPEGYVLTCPYCGSEAIYETGGYYKCAECGNSIYDPDDLELAYIDGYMDLLAPVSLTIN